ncbi:uncharacterized protein N7496_002721 [Penicillium cataractarum]|uniref:HMG box domain-containing protein n=1 Tax=Penicillium cataractarum TaxID=2100454 RepID=A0A9W9SPU5_9EURO|nr:uncharacterized protein N7496_002721 [Penicillium cataractarum]KAJ5380293.1 hypothetical protein N7496_002721 [Penicillium cataractarum]
MNPTLPAGGFPPTPPQTSEEEKTPERRMEAPMESYPPVPMYAVTNGFDQGALHGNEINPHSQPQQTLPISTPPAESLGSASPSWSPPTRNQNPASKSKVTKSRSGRSRGKRDGTAASCNLQLTGPLSIMTKDMVDPPVRDMEAWVNRSLEERQQEVDAKNGEIPRPMNSFMLYRSAYIARIKNLLGKNCNQNVSRIAGVSWRAETKEVREKFENLAVLERQNHATSHPGYKFKPHKGPATTTRRTDEYTPPRSSATPGASIRGSSVDWDDRHMREGTPSMMHHRSESFDVGYMPSSRGSTPFGTPDSSMLGTGASGYLTPMWSNTSYPSSGLHPIGSHVEDLQFSRASPMPHELPYVSSTNGLTGIPGASHELLQPQPTHPVPSHIIGGHMDPQLLEYPSETNGLPILTGPPTPPTNPYHLWAEEGCYLPTAHSAVPSPVPFPVPASYPVSMQRGPSWDAKYPDPNSLLSDSTSQDIDSWLDQPSSNY